MAEEKNIVNEEILNTSGEAETEAGEEVFAEAERSDENNLSENPAHDLEQINRDLEKKIDEAENRYLRLQADFDNFRRRTRLDAEAQAKYKSQSLITEILPALDNFERALKMEADSDQAKSLLQGMEMVYRSLVEALNKEGVTAVDSVGKEFDPNLHQAVMQVEDENAEPNTVIEEFQKGYLLKDRVIRPAMVKVSQ